MDNASLIIKTKLYNSESFELIEYDSNNYIEAKKIINTSGILFRKKNKYQISFYNNDEDNLNNTELLKIIRDNNNGNYSINAGNYSSDLYTLVEQEPAFLVYRSQQTNNESEVKSNKKIYKLSKGDIIKLGRVYVKVLDIVLKNKSNQKYGNKKNSEKPCLLKSSTFKQMTSRQQLEKISLNNSNHNNITNVQKSKLHSSIELLFSQNILDTPKNMNLIDEENDDTSNALILKNNNKNNDSKTHKKSKKICRICYNGDVDEDNPLIYPCNCKGSMKYIHYKCLRNWLNSKIENNKRGFFKTDNCIAYLKKELACELCKVTFPDFIKYKNKLLNLTLYDSKYEQYIILESMKVNKLKQKFIYILSLDKYKYFTLGRSKECDVIFPELSVSRYHCYIFKDDNNGIYIEDNSSKFGTLALIQNPKINMLYKKSLRIQKDKTYIKIDLDIPFSIFCCCNVNNTLEQKIKPYEIQNQEFLDVDSCFVIKDNYDIETEQESNNEIIEKSNNDIIIIDNTEKKPEKNIKRNNEKKNGQTIGSNYIKIIKIKTIKNNNENSFTHRNINNSTQDLISIRLHKNKIKDEYSSKREKQASIEESSKRYYGKNASSRSSCTNILSKRDTNRLSHFAEISSFLFRSGLDSCGCAKKIKLKKKTFTKNCKNYK